MSIKKHEKDYKPKAWEQYTLGELGMWVHLLTKRAEMRNNQVKKEKDLYDASNYRWMLQQKIKDL